MKHIGLKTQYVSFEDKIAEDFLIPALMKADSYKRAVGYFSVKSLEILASGLENIIEKAGKVQFVFSPELNDKDIEIIKSGYQLKESTVIEHISNEVNGEHKPENPYALDLIVHMIREGILELKIAFMNNGIFHEKIGVISNSYGESISFNGSMNETFSGYEVNTESITVFNNWTPGISDYADGIKDRFERIWNNSAKGIEVIDFPDAIKNDLIRKYRISSSLMEALENYRNSKNKNQVIKDSKPKYSGLKLYGYQEDAIEEFKKYNCQHFYEMATGTGKTFTAIRSIDALEKIEGAVYVTVIVPSVDLQIQWYEEFLKAGYENVFMLGGYKSNSNWKYEFERSLIEFADRDESDAQSVVYIAVSDSYFDKMVQEITIIDKYFIIIDEAHDLSMNKIKKLPKSAKYRLGLSATPERHNEFEINAILKYFLTSGQESYKYTIEDAISSNALTKYCYYPIPVELTEEEYLQYKKYSRDIMIEMNKKDKDEHKIQRLLNERSRVVKKAVNKETMLVEEVRKDRGKFVNSVVYCGAGKTNNEEENSILHNVTKALYEFGDLRVSSYTSKTDNRKKVLEEFENNFYETLVAIKCFDQGVDVPKLEKIHLMASDSIKRQTVQRRGRVLRKCKETGKALAHIYDYVALPPSHLFYEPTMSTLLKNELYRVEEYVRLAENKEDAMSLIEGWKELYPILEEEVVEIEERKEYY